MQRDLYHVDWSKLPVPLDDSLAVHLCGAIVPNVSLPATNGEMINLSYNHGLSVVYAYPRTGTPGKLPLFDDWDMIPGARGCTPQACAFRDHTAELKQLGVNNIFGLSTQTTEEQKEVVERLDLPFLLLSDNSLEFTRALNLPTFGRDGVTLLKRITLIVESGKIIKFFYPVFPPDKNAEEVIKWLKR